MAAGAVAGAEATAIVNAIKVSGVLVRVEPEQFSRLLNRAKDDPLIVVSEGGIFSTNYQYLMSYKGLTFFTKSRAPLPLPVGAELVKSRSIWIPG
jgi:hypothetical protein